MIVLFIIEMNGESTDEGNVGVYRSKSPFLATLGRGHGTSDLGEHFISRLALITHPGSITQERTGH